MPSREDSKSRLLARSGYAWFVLTLTIGFVAVVLLGFQLSGGSPVGQVPMHQWLGTGLAGGMVVHLLLHRRWLVRVLHREHRELPRAARTSRNLVVVMTLLLLIVTISGFGMGGFLDGELTRGTVWQGLHHLSSKLLLLSGTWHIVRRWRWLASRLSLPVTVRSN